MYAFCSVLDKTLERCNIMSRLAFLARAEIEDLSKFVPRISKRNC